MRIWLSLTPLALALLLRAAAALDACPAEACGAAQPHSSALCPAASASGAASAPGGSPEKLFFRNDAPHAARLLRVDENGAEHEHALLAPASRLVVETAQGVVWRARAADRRLLVEHRVAPVRIDGCACPPRAAPPCNRPPFRGYRSTWDPVVFENDSPLPVRLSWYDGDCAEALQIGGESALPPFSSARFIATYGHTFRAHAADSPGLLLREHTIGDLVIRGCGERQAAAAGAASGAPASAAAAADEERAAAAHEAAAAALVAANNALRLKLVTALHELTSLQPGATNGTHHAPIRSAGGASAAARSGASAAERALSLEQMGALRSVALPLVGAGSPV